MQHFTRLFTAMEGRSPAVWRREYLEGIRKDVYINPHFENRIFTVGAEGASPGEYTNLAGDAAQASTVRSLRAMLGG